MWAAILHRDADGGVHVHLFAARCDLATGLSLNIAPPGWERTFDPLRDAFNYEHGWSRPDDPSRARPFRPAPHLAYQARLARRAGEDVEPDVRDEIGMHLLELVAAGRVKDRAGVVAVLEERGYDVPRQGDHYVTARDPETGERWRLRGSLYERDFDRERFLREAPEPSAGRKRADGDDDPAAAAWKAGEKARRRRADYNRAYYGRGHRPGRDGVQVAGVAGEVEREIGPAAGRSAGHDASLAAHLERELGGGAVAAVADAAEPERARRAAAGEGRGERSLAAADALAEAARAAGPELSRALGEHVAVRERAVRATSMGEQWLAEAQQEVLVEEEDRPLTIGERTRAVKTVEGRLETDLSRRESAIAATTVGPALLQEAFGERSDGDAPLNFSAWERVLDGVEQRVDEALRIQEEALRAIQAAAERSNVPVSDADVRAIYATGATHEAGIATVERTTEALAAAAAQQLPAETILETWKANESAPGGIAAALDAATAAAREEQERKAAAERAAALRTATEAAQAAAARSAVELRDDEVRTIYATGATHEAGIATVERTTEALAAAAAQQLPAETILETWKANESAPGGIAAALAAATAAAREEQERKAATEMAAALRTATEAAQAAAARSAVELRDDEVQTIYATGATHEAGIATVERTTEALAAAAAQQLPAETILETWKANESAPGGIAAALDTATAAAREEQERKAAAERAAALRTATEATQAAAARSAVELRDDEVRTIYATGATHEAGIATVERTTEALAAAAAQQLPAETILETWKANESAPGGIAAALAAATAAAREEQERKAATEMAAALRTATEAAQAAAARSAVELRDDEVQTIYATGATHEAGIATVERTTEALAAAAAQQLPAETILETWKANESAPGGIAAALAAATAAAREEQERKAAAERAAALRTATEATQAAAARSGVELRDADVHAIYATGATHVAGIWAVEEMKDCLVAATTQQLPAETILETWKANESAPGGIAAALSAVTRAAREERRKEAVKRNAAREAATEAAQAAADRAGVELREDHFLVIYATGATPAARLAAVERTTEALAAAAAQQLPAETILETWKANESAPGGIAAALDTATAAAREEQERKAAAERAAALRTATEATQAAAARSGVELRDADVHAIYATGATHVAGIWAVEEMKDCLVAATTQQLPAETILETWKANESAPGGIAAALSAVTRAAREERRKEAVKRNAAREAATEAAQVAADRAGVELREDHFLVIYATGATPAARLAAVERTTEALAAAAAQQLPAETILETWKANESAPGGIAAALDTATAAAREEQERKAAAAEEQSPPAQPTLEQRYRERFPEHAADVDRPEWSLAKRLQREHQAIRDRTQDGRRTELEIEYEDCFQRRDHYGFTSRVKELPALPHCLRDTDEPLPDNEQDPLREIDRYAESLPARYHGAWSKLNIAGRARAAIDKLWVSSPSRNTNAVRDECGADARTFEETMRKDRESRALVLGIVHRIHEVRYWEKQQEERAKDPDKTEARTEDRTPSQTRGRPKDPLR